MCVQRFSSCWPTTHAHYAPPSSLICMYALTCVKCLYRTCGTWLMYVLCLFNHPSLRQAGWCSLSAASLVCVQANVVPSEGDGAGQPALKEGPHVPTGQSTAFLESSVQPPMEPKGGAEAA
jgi:hypothetical protein